MSTVSDRKRRRNHTHTEAAKRSSYLLSVTHIHLTSWAGDPTDQLHEEFRPQVYAETLRPLPVSHMRPPTHESDAPPEQRHAARCIAQ